MREIKRTIVSGVVFSKDGKMLMGRKDPSKGGVYPDAWHMPGGGVEEGESLEDALARELLHEVGIDVAHARVVKLSRTRSGSAEKTLPDGERVLANMDFNYFEVHLDKNADEIALALNEDLVEAQWFDRQELSSLVQPPGSREFFQELGYIDADIPSEFRGTPK